MKNKKGFTLIELLAIIVILAIIAVITVPVILGIIDNAKKGAAVDSAYGYKDSINKYYVSTLIDNNGFSLNGTFTVEDGVLGDISIPTSGTKPTSGTLTYENNELVSGCLVVDRYKIEYIDGEFKSTGTGDCDIALESTPERCFAHEDNGDDTVTITEYLCGGKLIEFDDGQWVIASHTDGEYMDVVIPNKIDGKNVTSIGDFSFSINDTDWNLSYDKNVIIDSIKIPSSVTSIGVSAFESNELTSIEIPSSVTSIGDYAFEYNKLTSVTTSNSITAGNSITSMGDYAFAYNQITSVTIGNSITSIGECAFAFNQITSVTIGDSVTKIGTCAFQMNNLESVTIPDNVENIDRFAFNNNELTSVTIGNSVTNIGDMAFSGNNLSSITIPNGVTSIGSRAFEDNPNLTINVIGFPSKPEGWAADWNANWTYSSYPVNWNYQG